MKQGISWGTRLLILLLIATGLVAPAGEAAKLPLLHPLFCDNATTGTNFETLILPVLNVSDKGPR